MNLLDLCLDTAAVRAATKSFPLYEHFFKRSFLFSTISAALTRVITLDDGVKFS